ncbi:hypothetical protein F5141DRAFT_1147584 [Pisolithus sp. B1]|nr:hypothetical protein F5141DRAFT_1147584 [Pisolithus sp. B1]
MSLVLVTTVLRLLLGSIHCCILVSQIRARSPPVNSLAHRLNRYSHYPHSPWPYGLCHIELVFKLTRYPALVPNPKLHDYWTSGRLCMWSLNQRSRSTQGFRNLPVHLEADNVRLSSSTHLPHTTSDK